jgi:hypothetical protein
MEPVQPLLSEKSEVQDLASRWFRALDRRQVDLGKRRLTARVMGIHLDGGEAWIQLAAGRAQEGNLVLHLSGWTTIDQVVAAMKANLVQRDRYPRIISVLPTA